MRTDLRTIQLVVMSALTAGCLSAALIARGQNARGQKPASTRRVANSKSVEALFKLHCAKCHGTDGRGNTIAGEIAGAPDFTDAEWQRGANDRRLAISITHGRGGMPAFKKKLTGGQVKSLVAHVRSCGK